MTTKEPIVAVRKHRVGTVCSGIGAPEVAWSTLRSVAGADSFEFVFNAEIEAFPSAVLAHHFPQVPNLGDMTQFAVWKDYAIDILVGGTPCQSFSVAGLRQGLADPRGNLMLTYAGIAAKYRPRWLVWENVPGVLSSSDGRDFAAFLGLITGTVVTVPREGWQNSGVIAGYRNAYGIAWRVLDAQYHGVAQRRRRVFVVGHLGGEWQRAAAVLFERESLCGNPPPRRQTREGIAPTLSARTKGGGGLGTDFDCDGGVIPIQEIGKRQSGTSENGVGYGAPGDPMFTLQRAAVHGVAQPMGIDGGEVGFALRSNASHSGDKGDGGVNCTMVVAPDCAKTLLGKPNCSHAEDQETYVAHALRGEGFDASEDGTGRGSPLVPEIVGSLTADTHPGSYTGQDAYTGRLLPEICGAVSSKWSKGSGGPSGGPSGDECQNMVPVIESTEKSMPIAFSLKHRGADATADLAPTLRAMPHNESHPNGGGQVAVALPEKSIAYRTSGHCGVMEQGDRTAALNTATDPNQNILKIGMAVRRLTPRECERLQGFPDDYTLITFRGKPAADGPRYKALGNSMCAGYRSLLGVMRWIGERILLVEAL